MISVMKEIALPVASSALTSLLLFVSCRIWNRALRLRAFYMFESINRVKPQIAQDVNGGFQIHLPITFEFYNPSDVNKAVRDISIILKKDRNIVCKLAQCDIVKSVCMGKSELTPISGGNRGPASISIGSHDIQRQQFLFAKRFAPDEEDSSFNRIYLRYYNTRGRRHKKCLVKLRKPQKCGDGCILDICQEEWSQFKLW